MFISRRTDYAIRLLLQLAHSPEQTVSVREVAEKQEIPYSFARNIQRELLDSGFIVSTRGATGGIKLAKPAQEISVFDVVDAVQGPVSCSTCTEDPDWCKRMPNCKVHPIWQEADDIVRGQLESKLLSDLI